MAKEIDMVLNRGQKDAVYTRGKDLMVSASAGTGKTFSLCMRILEELRQKEHPASVDRMLIVTFTRAAAADMRRKLTKELKTACESESDPEIRAHLKKQKSLLPGARIGTIDSFYLEMVTAHFDALGIPPRIRLANRTEMISVKQRLMKDAMARMYKGRHGKDFERLVGNMIKGYRDNKLIDTFIDIYEKTENRVEGAACLKAAAEEMEAEAELPFAKGLHGAVIVRRNKNIFGFFVRVYRRFLDLYAIENGKAFDVVREELALWEQCEELSNDPLALLAVLSGADTKRLQFSKEFHDDPEVEFLKTVRDFAKEFIRSEATLYLDTDLSRYREFFKDSARLTDCLFQLLSLYGEMLFEQKKKKGVMEFSDVARMTYNLLYTSNGEKSEIALKLSEEIDELYIDEYQDVNELQDRIFLALSKKNRFIVGDVKQSIYRFRGACPDIFNGLRESYADICEKGSSTGKIFLRENYRSSVAVLSFVNACIGPLMRLETDIHYMPEDDLVPGKSVSGPLPAICYVYESDPMWEDKKRAEAVYTAKSLKKILQSGVNAQDVAILVRSNKSIPIVREALEKEGISTECSYEDGFFDNPEILLLRCLVEAVDNPTKDICLAGMMKSPIFGFTLDELTAIRREGRGESLFSALNDYTGQTEDARCQRVLSFISAYRKKAQEYPADTLIFRMMDELMILPLLTADKDTEEAQRIRNNILAFYDIVRGIAAGGERNLGKIVLRLEDMAKSQKTETNGTPGDAAGKVRIMTIHASKGLEFQVCWLYGAGKSIFGANRAELDPKLGYSFGLQDEEIPWLQNKTAVQSACAVKSREESVNEELRLLYVALTRAVSQLYISCAVSENTLANLKRMENYPMLDFYLLEKNSSYIKWIKMALGHGAGLYREFFDELPAIEAPAKEEQSERKDAEFGESLDGNCVKTPTEPSEEKDCELECLFEKRLNFIYPHRASVDLPAKKAVSALHPSVLDDGEEQQEIQEVQTVPKRGVCPKFYLAKKGLEDESDYAVRGSATHAFMQFCNFETLEKEGFEKEVKRLVDQNFLSWPVAKAVEKRAVENFLKSRLFKSLKEAKKVFREQRFMIALPAREFTSIEAKKEELGEEKLLIQGVIDCFFVDSAGKLVLFDYKTDHFSSEERKDIMGCEKILRDRHTEQLEYYREAVRRMMGRPVDRCCIYSFSLNKEVEI